MIVTESTITIERTVNEVFAFVCDATHDPQWHTMVKEAAWITTAPATQGSKFRWVVDLAGRHPTEMELTICEPDRRAQLRTLIAVRGLSPVITYFLAPCGAGTAFTRRVEVEAIGPMALLSPLLALVLRRGNIQYVTQLKALLESGVK